MKKCEFQIPGILEPRQNMAPPDQSNKVKIKKYFKKNCKKIASWHFFFYFLPNQNCEGGVGFWVGRLFIVKIKIEKKKIFVKIKIAVFLIGKAKRCKLVESYHQFAISNQSKSNYINIKILQ